MHLANQIAAGEVVQRPESVVKELVENALDSGAEHIQIIISGSGKNVIQVIDDGSGMSDEDAVLAFERHATSKITALEDLEAIMTFGFRGEALPSIASIAKVEVKTRQEQSDLATYLRIEAGRLEERSMTQFPVGTSITVRNLFYNTPARRQFLKSDSTEYRHIADTVQRYIISYPHIRITFVSEDNNVYDAPPGTLQQRLAYLFGDKFANTLIDLHEETEMMTVSGFVGRPNFAKKTRGEQFLFVNGRYIVSRLLNHAIVSCYENMIEQGEYPFYCVFLNISPKAVDVNVHPSKLEVKFSNERNIYTMINAIVRKSLFRNDLSPSMGLRDITRGDDFATGMRLQAPEDRGESAQPRYDSFSSLQRGMNIDSPIGGGQRMNADQVDDLFRSIGLPGQPPSPTVPGDRMILLPSEKPVSDTQFLWQLHNKYIFTPIKSGLMIIDQHVAHERVLYEKALQALDHAAPFSQQLLFPQTFRISASDFALVEELHSELEHLGFVIELSPPTFVSVNAVPQDVRFGMEEVILQEIIEQYKDYSQTGITDVRHSIAASFGCKAAIKAGDKLSPPEMQILIDKLFATTNPYVCPHGRPIVIKLSLEELDLRFGRT